MSIMIWVIISALFIIVLLSLLRVKFYQNKLEVELYTKSQLLNKISKMKQEKHQFQTKEKDSSEYHLDLRRAKQTLTQDLDALVDDEKIRHYRIFTTSQIAPKNTIYPFISQFDILVVTNIGLILLNLKALKAKTFYHFEGRIPLKDESDIHQIVGHYIAHQYHNQFQSELRTHYTFSENIHENEVTYQFNKYDPYEMAEKATQNLQMHFESLVDVPVSTIGVIYCAKQNGERIDGDATPYSQVYTCENNQDFQNALQQFIATTHTNLSDASYEQVINNIGHNN
ncbi:hypothetical protein RN70_07470 [Staphylococcus schleiferi]|uniref:hypothetical protein n=1 Tax=Staphylococcus coagulans TaxID=74706 RepID=UPI000679F43F|nr:hypothetical protein [Staphylococcus coagulans]AKS69359.1 hypothetical protein NP71_07275 [Staphylococcus schleiferi]AKS71529.1 hypothetical protein OA96_06865 [Staphylococcus schleiferi]AKS73749.1 hypothetical protein RN70_07470 [Staphylococcus schleiferi]MBA8763463.1 hypothetical protein [Staphylococcus coagulans]MBT2809038.1 hypothetical protein [Staphylococcus coagulans]